ncbi:MAG: Disulfide bond formation protein B [Holosporales bacterium]
MLFTCPICKVPSPYVYLGLAVVLLFGLLSAYFSQYVLGIEPCAMCFTQRYIYMISIGMVALTGLFGQSIRLIKWISLAILCANLAYSGYHVGVEQKWWKGPDSCTSTGQKLDLSQTTDEDPIERLKKHLQTKKVVLCDEISWRILNIPATVLNTLFLFILCLVHLRVNLRCRKS